MHDLRLHWDAIHHIYKWACVDPGGVLWLCEHKPVWHRRKKEWVASATPDTESWQFLIEDSTLECGPKALYQRMYPSVIRRVST